MLSDSCFGYNKSKNGTVPRVRLRKDPGAEPELLRTPTTGNAKTSRVWVLNSYTTRKKGTP